MPVPDDVIFAKSDGGRFPTYYGMVRKMGDDERLAALKRRLDEWLVDQVDELGKEEGGKSKVHSPFPLAILTCVAMETLGTVMYFDESRSNEENIRIVFRTIAAKMHPGFSRNIGKAAKLAFRERWGDSKETNKVKTAADLLYTYFRNTLIHRYQGLGVQITEESTDTYKLTDNGTLVLDPYWLWRRFKSVYSDLFHELATNLEPTNARQKSALRYVEQLIS